MLSAAPWEEAEQAPNTSALGASLEGGVVARRGDQRDGSPTGDLVVGPLRCDTEAYAPLIPGIRRH